MDGQLVLRWSDPGNSSVDRYELQRRLTTPPEDDSSWTTWAQIPESDDETTSYRLPGLANGSSYTVQLRAANARGPGAAATTSATPSAPSVLLTDFATINASAIAGDGTIDILEQAADLTITGTATASTAVSVRFGGAELTTTSDDDGAGSVTATRTGSTDGTANAAITVDLTKPAVSHALPTTLQVGVKAKLSATTTDTDIASHSACEDTPLPSWFSLGPLNGILDGVPTAVADAQTLYIVVSDRAENSSDARVSLPAVTGPAPICVPMSNKVVYREVDVVSDVSYYLLTDEVTAQGQTQTGTRFDRRTLVWQGSPDCDYPDPDDDAWIVDRNEWNADWNDLGPAVPKPAD